MTHPHRRPQAGFTLVELLVALVIAAIIASGIIQSVRERLDEQKQAATALQVNTYANAVFAYQQANQSTLLSSTGPSTPATITTAQLIAAGLLPAGFSDITPYSQTLVARVLQPTAGSLDPVVATVGGSALTDVQVHGIAAQMSNQGGQGGFIDSRNSTTAVGLGGWWSKAITPYGINPGIGHVVAAIFLRMVATTDDSLHRHATAGSPQYNQMATDIDMSHHSLNNVKSINLDAGNAVNIGGSLIYGDGSNLATRSGSGNLYIQNSNGSGSGSIVQVHNIVGDGSSTFTAYNISASNGLYAASYVNSSGTMYASSNISTAADVVANGAVYASNWLRTYGNTGWYSQTYGGGWYMQDSTWIRAYNNKNIYTGGQVQAGSVLSNGRLTTKEYLEIDSVATAGTACSGRVASMAADGTFLTCVNSKWTEPGGTAGQYYFIGNFFNANYTGHNYTAGTMWVVVRGRPQCGTSGWAYEVFAYVGGNIIANTVSFDNSHYSSQTMTFPVPSGQDYQITYANYSCNSNYYVYEYR